MHKTIGILIIDVEGTYSRMIWNEVARYTRQQGYDLVILPADSPNTPHDYLYQYNSLLNFINSSVMDVLIFSPSLLENHLSIQETEALVSRIQAAVPIVSLNYRVKDAPSILIDNSSGIHNAVAHLVHEHDCRRIGFVTGPEENEEARERKAAFTAAMQAEGITPPETWFIPGNFVSESSRITAINRADSLVADFDALICANDYSAIGIIEGLQEKGYSVPEDLAVIGFDDIQEAPYLFPALTTVKQPIAKMALRSAQIAIEICEGRNQPQEVMFETELVVRATCGCTHFTFSDIITEYQPSQQAQYFARLQELLRAQLSFPVFERIYPAFHDLLSLLFTEEVSEENRKKIIMRLESVLDTEFYNHNSLPNWSVMVTILHDLLFACNREKYDEWVGLKLFDRARVLVGYKQDLWHGHNEIEFLKGYIYPLREIQRNMTMVLNHEDIVRILEDSVGGLGITNMYLTLLQNGSKVNGLYSAISRSSACIFAYNNGSTTDISHLDSLRRFETLQLIPQAVRPPARGVVWVAGPLYNRESLYGFIISDLSGFNASANESIRNLVSVALRSSYLNREREKAESKLRTILNELEIHNRKLKRDSIIDEMTGLLNRRGFFQDVQTIIDSNRAASTRYALLFCDMDGLKQINDSLGHEHGDQAIQDMAEILQDLFREEDSIARLGGDEFTVFAIDIPEDFETVIKTRMEKQITEFHAKNARPYRLSISIGVIEGYTSDERLDIQQLMSRADKKLYQNKRNRNL